MRPNAILIACSAILVLTVFQNASGQSDGGSFGIDHVTITGGGTLSGGAFGLKGTFGQPLIGNSSGGPFTLEAGARLSSDSIFSSGFESQ